MVGVAARAVTDSEAVIITTNKDRIRRVLNTVA
jgi:hypothetical protein